MNNRSRIKSGITASAMANPVLSLKVEKLIKEFHKGAKPKQTLKEYFVNPFSKHETELFRAVDDMSFEVKKGEFFGIIGRNGSGKSTLLKMLAGILEPTSGTLDIHGRIVPFLELGVGFNPELTARENVFLNGAILGMTKKQLKKKFDDIIKFAEIEDFVDTQVKNFSSGMYVRLAFAIAIQAEADIYLIDEILAVGDYSFQQKCFNLFRELKKSGKTFIFVTHDLGSVREFCDRALYIRHGKMLNLGETDEVIKDYVINDKRDEKDRIDVLGTDLGRNTTEGGAMKISVLDVDDNELVTTVNDRPLKVRVDYQLRAEALKDDLIIGFGIYRNGNDFIFGTNSFIERKQIEFKERGTVEFVIKNFPFLHGHYGVSAAIHNKENHHYVWEDNAAQFDVVKASTRDGLVNLETEIRVRSNA